MSSRQLDEERIFHVARDLSNPVTRADYLDQVCAGDQALRERVEALLQAHEQSQGFLRSRQPEPAPTVESTSLAERPGTTIGRYRLMEQIGEGGMGIVFVAEQERPIRRKVAIKVIKPGMDSKAVVARFEAERQALAMMDHANIAKVFDAGTTDSGHPYFAMQLVKGVPITEYCDRNRLTIRERLELFIQVCQAIQHAHQKGIIHRDIKPSNVLVTLHDGKPVPKVIDFGVAKAINARLTDRTIYTEHLQVIGTLLYMSPEQAELSGLDIDTRSDIYSLGVLLYELLTGTTPFPKKELDDAAFDEQRRIIREHDPPRASVRISSLGETATAVAEHRKTDVRKLHQLVRGDLDWIVLKAIEKDRVRRYETASGFAADVERFLEHEPVDARPPSAGYRLSKFVRRNRSVVIGTLVIIAVLLAGVIGTTSGLIWAVRERDRATGTLVQLQNELVDRAFDLALSGDVVEVKDALERAAQANADRNMLETIEGISYLHGGDVNRSIAILESALERNPDNILAMCGGIWAYYYSGLPDPMYRLRERLRKTVLDDSVLDSRSRLMLAQVRVYGTRDLKGLLADLDKLVADRPRWAVAYALRAEAKSQIGQLSQDRLMFDDAAKDAEKALRLSPDNPFVLSAGMFVYTYIIQLERCNQHVTQASPTRAEQRAADIAQRIDEWKYHLEARMRRLLYYRLVNEHENFSAEYQALVDQGIGGPQPTLSRLLPLDDVKQFNEAAHRYPSVISAQVIRGLRHLIDGEEHSAFDIFERIMNGDTPVDLRALALDIPRIAQRPEMVKEMAQLLWQQVPPDDPPTTWRFELYGIAYAAGELSEDELFARAGPFHWEKCMADFYVGVQALCEGNVTKARTHLELAANCVAPGWWVTNLSRAYLQLLDTGKLPLPKPDALLNKSAVTSPKNK